MRIGSKRRIGVLTAVCCGAFTSLSLLLFDFETSQRISVEAPPDVYEHTVNGIAYRPSSEDSDVPPGFTEAATLGAPPATHNSWDGRC